MKKQCRTCHGEFARPRKSDEAQWARRIYCSTMCADLGKSRPGNGLRGLQPRVVGVRAGWQHEAACRGVDPGRFDVLDRFEAGAVVALEQTARKFCGACPVAAECRTWAEQVREVGLWGGTYFYGVSKGRTVLPLLNLTAVAS